MPNDSDFIFPLLSLLRSCPSNHKKGHWKGGYGKKISSNLVSFGQKSFKVCPSAPKSGSTTNETNFSPAFLSESKIIEMDPENLLPESLNLLKVENIVLAFENLLSCSFSILSKRWVFTVLMNSAVNYTHGLP